MYHPDITIKRGAHLLRRARGYWDVARQDLNVADPAQFKEALVRLVEVSEGNLESLRTRAEKLIARVRQLPQEEFRRAALTEPLLREYAANMRAPYQAMTEYLLETQETLSFGKLLTDRRYQYCMNAEEHFMPGAGEGLNTDRVLRFAIKTYDLCGRKLYTVAPSLSWQMRNIHLRKMPQELLHAPFPCFYLVCPTEDPFRIYNNDTGWHTVEGLYIMEDTETKPRSWRMLLTAGPNENSVHPEDDALYHYYILLKPGMTLEECIEVSIEHASKSQEISREVDGEPIYSTDLSGEQLEAFQKSKQSLIEAFKYAVNVILYTTHPDAEQEVFNSNPEFQALYKRALKAKGKKRKDLFARASSAKGDDRILLGRSVTVSREEREATETSGRKGSKHRVRTFVAAHWQHYWTGPRDGERERKYLLKKAHWKGDEHAPVSSPTHKVK